MYARGSSGRIKESSECAHINQRKLGLEIFYDITQKSEI